ncbi:hypothetical protein [Jiangella asiatica]|uniref:Uncharacterized protein n=1 Tax=Jiangella asiatica TaxID=2530372 RepID=A0A4R5CPF8_9ACTN|nr:hypothetical protein [Jiangella asiatica]TDE00661.1 hypothetical protein E1269_24685 [Jiangella asiatica]
MTDRAEPPRYPQRRPRAASVRSRLMLEVASELVGTRSWPHQQVRVDMRAPGAADWATSLFASDGVDAVEAVLSGASLVAIINPATAVQPALLRLDGTTGDELAAIATVPSYDQLGLAVPRALGLGTLDDLVAAAPALRLSLRGNRPNHLVHLVLDDTLRAGGASVADLESWGGTVRYDNGLPHASVRAGLLRGGAVDAVFDEGVYNWVELATDAGLSFLDVPDDAMARLTVLGYRRGWLRRQRYPALAADVATVDFSGFLIFTRADAAGGAVGGFCEALVAARDRIAWQGGSTLPLERMCADAVDAPLPIPFHPAAEAVWRRHGLL